MKKILAIILCMTMIFTLTACGGDGAGSSGTPSPASTPEPAATEPPASAAEPEAAPEAEPAAEGGKTLVVYYSASGNTERVASAIASATGGDTLSLEPVNPYSSEDLDWTADGSRVNREHDDESLRDIELVQSTVDNWAEYDTVYIGYPIWWGISAWPVDTFVKANDFTGKTVIPFCTSSSSGLGESGQLLADMAGTGDWQEGQRFQSSASDSEVREWVQSVHPAAPADTGAGSTLIAYFTLPEDVSTDGVDAVSGASIVMRDGVKLGSCEFVAKTIQETIGGDLFQIETVQQYPLDHEPPVDQAADEKAAETRPELAARLENLDQYDTIILGFPNWWADLPMPVYTFLESYDFSGKTIIPFVTHGGSGFSSTVNTIAALQPGATVSENTLSLSRGSVAGSESEVISWAQSLGLN